MRRIHLTVLAVLVPAAFAAASDSKIYPASMCQPASSSHAARANFTGNGRVCNTSDDADLTLRCPIVRDTVAGHISHFRMYAKNAHPSINLTCVLRTLRPDSEDGWGWFQTLSVDLVPPFDPDAWQMRQSFTHMSQEADGPYELTCTLPRAALWSGGLIQSCLGAYRVEEAE